jgi:hypothetical protein
MNWNIAIGIAIAVIVAITSGLGGHLTSTKNWHKWVFWGGGILGVVLISVQIFVNEKSQQKLQGQLDTIEKNTKTPPNITVQPPVVNIPPPVVNIPPGPKPRTYVQVNAMNVDPGFSTDKPFRVNVVYQSHGPIPVDGMNSYGFMYTLPGPPPLTKKREDEIWAAFIKHIDKEPISRSGLGVGQGGFFTLNGTPLSETELENMRTGAMILYVVGTFQYKDSAGTHTTNYCSWLQPLNFQTDLARNAIWHWCRSHNEEK